MGGGLECFFRTHYHIFPWVTIRITTHVTIFLWEFCTVSNALLLLTHYYINHCVPYYTFSVTWVLICMFVNTLPHVTISFLKKEYINILKHLKLIVTRGNALENWQLCTILLKMYGMTFSNTSGNVLKIVTNKIGAKFP